MVGEVGILMAPGARHDYSLNQYLQDSPELNPNRSRISSFFRSNYIWRHPSNSSTAVFSAMRRFEKKGCAKVFVLGEQCRFAVSRYLLNSSMSFQTEIFLMNDPRNQAGQFLELVDTVNDKSGNAHKIQAFNFGEGQLSSALCKAICYLVSRVNSHSGYQSRIALITAANVPIIQKWIVNFEHIWTKHGHPNKNLLHYNLGSGYSKFDDPKSAYYVAKHVIENHNVEFIVQLCGASSIGITHAIREAKAKGRIVYYVPYDYYNWDQTPLPKKQMPLALVRNIDQAIISKSSVGSGMEDILQSTGKLVQFDTNLGMLTAEEINEICCICDSIEIVEGS